MTWFSFGSSHEASPSNTAGHVPQLPPGTSSGQPPPPSLMEGGEPVVVEKRQEEEEDEYHALSGTTQGGCTTVVGLAADDCSFPPSTTDDPASTTSIPPAAPTGMFNAEQLASIHHLVTTALDQRIESTKAINPAPHEASNHVNAEMAKLQSRLEEKEKLLCEKDVQLAAVYRAQSGTQEQLANLRLESVEDCEAAAKRLTEEQGKGVVLQKELVAVKESMAATQKRLNEQLKQSMSEHRKTQQACTRLEAELEALQVKHRGLNAAHVATKEELAASKKSDLDHRKQLAQLRTAYDELTENHAQLKAKHDELTRKYGSLKNTNAELEESNADVKGALATMTGKHDDLSKEHQSALAVSTVRAKQLETEIETNIIQFIKQAETEETSERAALHRKINEAMERCRTENKMPLAIMNANSTDIPPEALNVVAREISRRFPMVDFVGLNLTAVAAPVPQHQRRGGMAAGRSRGGAATTSQATTAAAGAITSSRHRPAFCTLHLNIRREARVPEGIVPNGLACRAEVYFYDGQGDLLFFRNRDCSELLGCHGTTNGMNAVLEWVGSCMTKYEQLDAATRRTKFC